MKIRRNPARVAGNRGDVVFLERQRDRIENAELVRIRFGKPYLTRIADRYIRGSTFWGGDSVLGKNTLGRLKTANLVEVRLNKPDGVCFVDGNPGRQSKFGWDFKGLECIGPP